MLPGCQGLVRSCTVSRVFSLFLDFAGRCRGFQGPPERPKGPGGPSFSQIFSGACKGPRFSGAPSVSSGLPGLPRSCVEELPEMLGLALVSRGLPESLPGCKIFQAPGSPQVTQALSWSQILPNFPVLPGCQGLVRSCTVSRVFSLFLDLFRRPLQRFSGATRASQGPRRSKFFANFLRSL